MKKIFLFVLLFLCFSQTFSMNPADLLEKVPWNFKPECYENYTRIDKSQVWNDNNYQTYKLKLDKSEDLVFTQFGFILPYKYYSDWNNSYKYENNLWLNIAYLSDYNNNTFIELNSKNQHEIILDFDEIPEKDNFSFVFDYISDNYSPRYYISDNKIKWNLIKKQDIESFSFKYLKIDFASNTLDSYLENIKLYELSFPKKSNTFLFKSFYNDDIEVYSKYNCKDKDFSTEFLNYDSFSINKDTKTFELNIEVNPKYDVYTKTDLDNDWVEDSEDNCKDRYNPDQSDINWDWVWDVCSDDDSDWILWYYDNCINVYNSDQKDLNINKVWDVCEFDKDKDWIFDPQDNCINTPNIDQSDKDKDWIGDLCDNCKSYNPSQLDANQNGTWDVCEEIENNLNHNDFDRDWIIDSIDNCSYPDYIPNSINREQKKAWNKYMAEKLNSDKTKYYNPKQEDDDKDWIWNICDNCLSVQNNNQLDFNKNKVWDLCEDSDNDWIEWLVDNCINISNFDQKDVDNDWIGDLCEDDDWDNILSANDNCQFSYNPDQKDIDNDKKWDACDTKDNRYIESNSSFFIWLIVIISLIFFWWIYFMFKKLK